MWTNVWIRHVKMAAFVRMLWEPTFVLAMQDGMVFIVKMVRTSRDMNLTVAEDKHKLKTYRNL